MGMGIEIQPWVNAAHTLKQNQMSPLNKLSFPYVSNRILHNDLLVPVVINVVKTISRRFLFILSNHCILFISDV